MSILVSHITKLYGQQKALDDVSFEIKPGEIVGLLGPNGAGKSTMMKILTCFIPPSSGNASVCGYDIIENPLEIKKKTGYLPENNPLYLDLYVREYLEYIAGIYHLGKEGKQKVAEMIELTGLQAEQKKKIGALSKGFRQRVGLAQALIHDPEVLIMDEPTSGLDPNQIVEIRELIKQVGKKKTIMLSTHIMQEVEAICNRTIIINEGRIVADSPTSGLNTMAAGKEITVKVEFNKAIDGKILQKLQGVISSRRVKDNEWLVASSPEIDLRPLIFDWAVKNDLIVLSMNKESQSLEEVFQELTRKEVN